MGDPEFQSVLVSCLERLERGERLDRNALLKANPSHADALGAFLADHELLRQVAGELRDSISREPSRFHDDPLEKTADSNPKVNPTAGSGERIQYIGEYEVAEEIARGGMGVVFKAFQHTLDRTVALKMLIMGSLANSTDVERFQREARAAGRLKHPHIVPIHEIGEHEGHHYFAMDFVEGQSLGDGIRDQTLAPQHAATLVSATADAVRYAHDQGVLHRDLKPANVLIDSAGQPHVTDFGLAKLRKSFQVESLPELTTSGQILGTPSYMSPEQASGKTDLIGPASDVYGLGGILYASITGRAPFVGDSPIDTLRKVIHDEPVSPRQLNPSISRDLEQICLKCLHKSPQDRYASAADLASDLRRFMAGEPVVARPLPRLTRLYRWSDRNIGKFTAIGIAVLLLLPLVVFLAFGSAFERWPWQLLLFSYPVMLVFLAPHFLMMLLISGRAGARRKTGDRSATHGPVSRSVPLLVIGGVLLAVAVAGYAWILLEYGWAVPQDARYLAIVAILGIGAFIRGLSPRSE